MVSLLDMPGVPMNLILDHGGLSVIFPLRKVCRNLRDYIDETMPDIHLNAIYICCAYKTITITWSHYLENVQISYKLHRNGCKTVFGKHEHFLENVDYMEGFWTDYNLIMKYQKSSIKIFHLRLFHSTYDDDASKFLEQYKNSRSLRTQYLALGIYQGDEVPIILQHLDVNCLKNIRLFSASDRDINIDFTEIVELDQWKNAQQFNAHNLSISAPMKHFTHFSKINAEFRHIVREPEDLNVLKEAAIRSPTFEKFIIEYHNAFNIRQILSELFGNPFTYTIGQNKWSWFFNTCREEKILQIDHVLSFNRINFSLIDRSMVPNRAEVKNVL